MESLMRSKLVPVSLVAIIVAAILSIPWPINEVVAQSEDAGAPTRSITVVGEGTVSIRPDVANANIGVEVMNESVQEASAMNRAVLEEVLAALAAQGIAENDIQTSGFSVFAERYGPEGPRSEEDVQYRVSNNVNVTIRDLDTVGEVLDAAIAAGANNIYGVEFALDDMSDAQSQAREQAIENAAEKAAEIAEFSGVSLGPIVSLSEVIGAAGGFYTGIESRAMGLGGGAPISPGELEVVYRIQAVYSMAD